MHPLEGGRKYFGQPVSRKGFLRPPAFDCQSFGDA